MPKSHATSELDPLLLSRLYLRTPLAEKEVRELTNLLTIMDHLGFCDYEVGDFPILTGLERGPGSWLYPLTAPSRQSRTGVR